MRVINAGQNLGARRDPIVTELGIARRDAMVQRRGRKQAQALFHDLIEQHELGQVVERRRFAAQLAAELVAQVGHHARVLRGKKKQRPTEGVAAGFVTRGEDHARVPHELVLAERSAVLVARLQQHRQHVAASAGVCALRRDHLLDASVDRV